MAYLMKILFPNTIDKFQDDFSIKIIEQKPIRLNNINQILNNINANNNNDYTLAANHCFIYNNERDYQELSNLPGGNNIYKLNVEQTKGLEFEIVIVYNFFTSSKFQKIWEKIFNNIKGIKNESINSSAKLELTKILYEENITYLVETLNLGRIYQDIYQKENEIKNKIVNELDDFIYPELDLKFDKHEIFEFCSELKKFYVLITRARTFLVFYENNLNIGRDGFYKLMESNNINLIVYGNQNNLLDKINKYFRDINLSVQTPDELRILGNNEFNEHHYSRALYLYKIGKNYLLELISEIFNDEENLNERINIYNEKNAELKILSKKIIDNSTKILEEHKKNNLYNKIEQDDNKINIENVLNQIINIKGKNLIFLKKFDEALEFYKEYNLINEEAMVYLRYKKIMKQLLIYLILFTIINSHLNL